MKLIHSLTNLGGRHTHLKNKLVALDGKGEKVTPIILESEEILEIVSHPVLTLSNLRKAYLSEK